jgi:ketosteroid isomerase-like protein
MKADAQTEAAVMTVLNRFAEDYAKRELEGVLALFAPDSDVVMFGSGADEKRVGLAEIKALVERDWSQSDAASFTYGWTSVSAAGPVAWVAADVTFKAKVGGQEVTLLGRLTGVLENRAGNWLLVQGHFSLPAATQAEGESFPT